jgi:hypothetical protein
VVEILHVAASGRGGAADAAASMKPEDREEVRRLAPLGVLKQLLDAAKARTDVVDWRAMGGPEAETLLHALETGGQHALLRRWETLKATVTAYRPVPDPLDLNARRLTVLMVEALHRAGLNKRDARKRAAKTVNQIFPTTHDAIRGWQSAYPTVTPDDEKLIARALELHGCDHARIVGWFVGLIRFAVDPAAAFTARRILIEKH